MASLRLAVTHANGLFAEALLPQLAEAGLPADNLILLDRSDRAGNRLPYGDTYLETSDQSEFDYEDLAAVLLLEADSALEELLVHADCAVISHHFDADHAAQALGSIDTSRLKQGGRIKLPDVELSCLQVVMAPLLSGLSIQAAQIVSVRSASLYGQSVIEELATQTIGLLNSRKPDVGSMPLQMAFNLQTVELDADKAHQLSELLGSQIHCAMQALLAPAFHGIAVSVALTAEQDLDVTTMERLWGQEDQIQRNQEVVSPLSHCGKNNSVIVSSLHVAPQNPRQASFWLIADSVRNPLLKSYLQVINSLQFE